MNINDLSDLPDWNELSKFDDDEGEEWKPNPTRDHFKALYKKWKNIVFMLNGVIKPHMEENTNEDDITQKITKSAAINIFSDAHIVATKILSSEAAGIYISRMENASIIRTNAQSISSSLLLLLAEDNADEEHVLVLRQEIEEFKLLFKAWVASFQKDEFIDDWGLFI